MYTLAQLTDQFLLYYMVNVIIVITNLQILEATINQQ